MLTANGEIHARRRSALSRALAMQVLETFRQHFEAGGSQIAGNKI